VDGTRHAGGGDARRQHPAADRGDAGGGRHGDRETRSGQRRETANARAHLAVALRPMTAEQASAMTSSAAAGMLCPDLLADLINVLGGNHVARELFTSTW
jgi:hypothetical protein